MQANAVRSGGIAAKTSLRNSFKETGMKILFGVAAAVFIAAVLIICLYLFARAFPAVGKIGIAEFLFGDRWLTSSGCFGIGSLVVGTCYSTVGALIVGVPIGLLTAVFLAFYCPKWLYKVLKPLTNILAGIPSVVYGYFGMRAIVPLSKELVGGAGYNLVTTSVVLGIMILPTVISIAENSLRAVPRSYYEGALALGATKERAIFCTVFPAAASGVMTAVILGLGRAIGETAAIKLICGNVAQIPSDLSQPFITLASAISSGMGYASGLRLEALVACAAVLFVFILIITTLLMLLRRKSR